MKSLVERREARLTQTLAKNGPAQSIEQVLIGGDLSALTEPQRLAYYMNLCESLKLNHLTKPFDYLRLNGRLVLYANKTATDQLRDIRKVSITRLEREQIGDLFVVTATATGGDGRSDSAIGAVPTKSLQGEMLANALMKAETKAKRRVTLSICGLGMLDESEVDSIPDAQRVRELSTDEIPRLAQQHAYINREANEQEIEHALQRNMNLLQQAYNLGIKNLKEWTGQNHWPIHRIEEANIELGKRIKEHQQANVPEDIQAAMNRNNELGKQAQGLGARGLRPYKAQPEWTLEEIELANAELETRIKEQQDDLEAQGKALDQGNTLL